MIVHKPDTIYSRAELLDIAEGLTRRWQFKPPTDGVLRVGRELSPPAVVHYLAEHIQGRRAYAHDELLRIARRHMQSYSFTQREGVLRVSDDLSTPDIIYYLAKHIEQHGSN